MHAADHPTPCVRTSHRGGHSLYLVSGDAGHLGELQMALSALPLCARGRVFVEAEDERDEVLVEVPSRMVVTWLPRSRRTGRPGTTEGCREGEALRRAVSAWAAEMVDEGEESAVPTAWLTGGYRSVAPVAEALTDSGVPGERIVTPAAYRLGTAHA